MRFPILYEDNHLLVIDKPCGWVTQGAQPTQPSVLVESVAYLKQKYNKPGDVFLGIVSRLDRPVSGVLPLARTSKAAARLSAQFREGRIQKTYWAIVFGQLENQTGTLHHWLVRDEARATTVSHNEEVRGSQQAIMHYTCAATWRSFHFLQIRLETGRKHQIRSQLAHIGCPIVGDRKYGSNQPLLEGIALHCRSLQAEHPTLKRTMLWQAPAPQCWMTIDVSIKFIVADLERRSFDWKTK